MKILTPRQPLYLTSVKWKNNFVPNMLVNEINIIILVAFSVDNNENYKTNFQKRSGAMYDIAFVIVFTLMIK